jgi:hypothetical protein
MSFLAKLEIGSTEYNVLNVDYEISQPIDHQNKPSGKPKGGIINLTIESNQKNDIIEWMVSPTMKKSGKVTFYRRDANSSMRTLSFNDGFCVNYKEIFDASGSNPMKLQIKVSAGEMKINNANSLVHPWSSASAAAAEVAKDAGNFNIASFMDNDTMQSAKQLESDAAKEVSDLKAKAEAVKAEAEKDIADAKKQAEAAKAEAEKEADAAKKEAMAAKDEAEKDVDEGKKEAMAAKDEATKDIDEGKKEAMAAKDEAEKDAKGAKDEATKAAGDAEKSAKGAEQDAAKSADDAKKEIPSFMP